MTPDRQILSTGKLSLDLLTRLLAPLAPRDPRVVVGAQAGEDAAVIEVGDTLLVVSSDPITFASEEIGRYAVAINANDVAVRGATPRWFLATVLLPHGSTASAVRAVMDDLAGACRELEIDLVGGHTEITPHLSHPIVSGTMLGEVSRDRLVTTGGARPGDVLLLGGGLAVEGTAVLARESGRALEARGVDPGVIASACDLLRHPGISIVGMARALCDAVHPHALHDPTEGGLSTALAELAGASRTGIHLHARAALPTIAQTRVFCDALGLDPLGLLASGALLAAVDPADAPRALSALDSAGYQAAVIGATTGATGDLTIDAPGGPVPLPRFARDELARWLDDDSGSA